jgi:hypothetical protein
MAHPLIDQFRFTRREWLRGLEGVSEEEAIRHFGPMNCISWIVGHLAIQVPGDRLLFEIGIEAAIG